MKKIIIISILLIGSFAGIALAATPTCTLTITPNRTSLGTVNTYLVKWTSTNSSNIILSGNDGNLQNVSYTSIVKNGQMSVSFIGSLTTRFQLKAGTATCNAVVYGTSTTQP